MIQMYNVTKVYLSQIQALVDVTLKIGKGEFVFLVGASGAGKSSFIKLLLREEMPTRGQIFVGGKSLVRMRQQDVPYHRRNIGVIFQDFRLLPNYTVYENVAFALRVVETSPREIPGRVREVLSLVGLEGKENLYPEWLSGGEPPGYRPGRRTHRQPGHGYCLGNHEGPDGDQQTGHHRDHGHSRQGNCRPHAPAGDRH